MADVQGSSSTNWVDAIMFSPDEEPKTNTTTQELTPDGLLQEVVGGQDIVIDPTEKTEETTEKVEAAPEVEKTSEVPEEVKPEDTATVAKRISKLVKQRKETEAKLAAAAAELDQFKNGFEQYKVQTQNQLAQSFQAIQAQNQALKRELEVVRGPAAPKKKPETLEEWEADFTARNEAKVQELARKMAQEALAPYQQKLKEQEALQRQVQEAAQWAAIDQEATEVAKNMLLSGIDESTAAELMEASKEFALTAAAAYGRTPKNAAEAQKQFLDKYFQARLKAEVAARKAKKGNAPAPVSAASVGSVTKSATSAVMDDMPDYSGEALKAAGYRNGYFEAFRDGFKKMKKKGL